MKIFKRCISQCLITLGFALVLQACSGPMVLVSPTPPLKYQNLGRVDATVCGVILGPLIPLGLNNRVKDARDQALAKAPGATSLINVEIKEDWAWALIAISKCTTISGDAVREVF